MIVTARDAERIEDGRKHRHRIPRTRVAPARHTVIPVSIKLPAPALGYSKKTGEPKLTTEQICRVRILDVGEGLLHEVGEAEAHLEGHRNRREFLQAWEEQHGPRRRVGQPVWVLSLALETEHVPRFLSTTIVAGRQSAYVSNVIAAMEDEPEAVDEFTLHRLSSEGRARHTERVEAFRERIQAMPLNAQVKLYEQQARARHVDIRDELRQANKYADNPGIVERQINLMREKLEDALLLSA